MPWRTLCATSLGGVTVALVACAFSLGCTIENEAHCGNQAGDETCLTRDPQAPFCSRCTADNDGCVSEQPTEKCHMPLEGGMSSANASDGDAQGGTAGSATSASSTQGSASGSGTSAGTTDAGTAGTEGTSGTTGTDDSGASDATTGTTAEPGDTEDPEPPVCGDGNVDGGEACDTNDLGDFECADPDGSLSCTEACEIDGSNCNPPTCGNGMLERDEQCDPDLYDNQSCAQFHGDTNQNGLVTCTDYCSLDTSNCCYPQGTACTLGGTKCCEGLVCRIALLQLGRACRP